MLIIIFAIITHGLGIWENSWRWLDEALIIIARPIARANSDLNEVAGGGEWVQDLDGLCEGDVADCERPGQIVHHPAPVHIHNQCPVPSS
jgi:hypothetical protein